jgi:hypothetical protein
VHGKPQPHQVPYGLRFVPTFDLRNSYTDVTRNKIIRTRIIKALRQHFLVQDTVPRVVLPVSPDIIPDLATPVNRCGTAACKTWFPTLQRVSAPVAEAPQTRPAYR